MKNKTTWIVILVIVLLLGGAYFLYSYLGRGGPGNQLVTSPAPAESETAAPETTAEEMQSTIPEATAPTEPAAPDFTVYDAQGNEVQLSDFFGKPIVLNFWASWCGPCQMEMPDFDRAYEKLKGKVHFVMVNMTDGSRETVESASRFIKDRGYSFPVFFDRDTEAAMTYGAYSLPTTFFIDGLGNAVAHAVGAIDSDTLQQGLDMILPR